MKKEKLCECRVRNSKLECCCEEVREFLRKLKETPSLGKIEGGGWNLLRGISSCATCGCEAGGHSYCHACAVQNPEEHKTTHKYRGPYYVQLFS